MQILIRLAGDELDGFGLIAGSQAEGERRSTLEQQIETWEALLEKLGSSE